MHNKGNALESFWNHSPLPPQSVEKLSSTKLVPVAKRLGTAAIKHITGIWRALHPKSIETRLSQMEKFQGTDWERPRAPETVLKLLTGVESKRCFPSCVLLPGLHGYPHDFKKGVQAALFRTEILVGSGKCHLGSPVGCRTYLGLRSAYLSLECSHKLMKVSWLST